jgi:hypothetical protein
MNQDEQSASGSSHRVDLANDELEVLVDGRRGHDSRPLCQINNRTEDSEALQNFPHNDVRVTDRVPSFPQLAFDSLGHM